MFIATKLAGFSFFTEGAVTRPFLRFTLGLFSLIGDHLHQLITGKPIDAESVCNDLRVALETAISGLRLPLAVRPDSLVTGRYHRSIRGP